MLLREALRQPQLRLTLLCGGESLDRPVSRVYVTDLPDPRRYLSGGEIVLTGLMWRRGPADSEAFVAACAAAEVAAIGAGDAAYGSVPEDLVLACRRHRIPLFEVPVEVSFRDIQEEINPSLWARRASGLATVLGRHRGLVAAMAGGARLADLLPPVAADLGVRCWVLTSTGRLVAGTAPLPEPARRATAAAFLATPRLPAQVTVEGRRLVIMAVPGRPEHRLAAWLLACAPATDPTGSDPTGSDLTGSDPNRSDPMEAATTGADAAAELVSLAALERAQVDETGLVERRLADQVGAVLAGRAGSSDLPGRLLSCGLPPDATFLALSAQLTGLRAPPELATAVCAEIVRAGGAGQPAVVTEAGPPDGVLAVLVVAPERVPTVLAAVRAAVAAFAPGLTGAARLAVGIGGPATGSGALAGAVEESRHALGAARSGPARASGAANGGAGADRSWAANGAEADRVSVVAANELASHLMLLAGLPADARRSFRDRLLGPLREYDDTHDAALLLTLDSFLSCSGSWTRCATLLHVHVNTLRYRIGRIEQLTGRDLARFEDRVDFFLALRLPDS